MLTTIGNLVQHRPWLVIGIILLITIGFGTLLPALQMETTMTNFLPDDPVVNANNRINDYFGMGYEMLMINIKTQTAPSVISPDALRETYHISKQISTKDYIAGVMGVPGFVDTICYIEYGEPLDNCTNEQITTAFDDLMYIPSNTTYKMMTLDDPNNPTDFQRFKRLGKGTSVDSMDIKNYYITNEGDQFCFSIEVYDISHYQNTLKPPIGTHNIVEWYLSFSNLIIPDERLNMKYTIAAHIEPTHELWELGRGPLKNLLALFQYARQRELFNDYTVQPILWISPPGVDLSLPISLESGSITFNTSTNRIEIRVNQSELGLYGIAIEYDGVALPARIGNSTAGFRYFQTPYLHRPWKRITVNNTITQRLLPSLQQTPYLSSLTTIYEPSYQTFDEFYTTLTERQEDFLSTGFSLKDIDTLWTTADTTPDTGTSETTYFIKPNFMDDISKSISSFLSVNYTTGSTVKNMLMMVQIDRSIGVEQLGEVSNNLVSTITTLDSESPYVTMEATSSSLIEYEINEVSMEANGIVIPLIFVVISIILLLSFWRLSYTIIPLIGLSISIVWLFGTMVLLNMPFMIMEVALIPMLMGLGVDYSVHLFHNYKAELYKGHPPGKAIVNSIQDIGTAMLLATITTFIAFTSFLTATMVPLRDFGILCAIGIAYTFIVAITFQAALRYLIDNRRYQKQGKKPLKIRKAKVPGMERLAKIICTHPLPILLGTILITGVLLSGAMQIKTGFEMEDFLPTENPSIVVMNNIAEIYPFSSQEKEYILIEGNIATVTVLEDIYKTQNAIGDDTYVLYTSDRTPKLTSILTVINTAVRSNTSLITTFNLDARNIPQSDAMVLALFDYLNNDDAYQYQTQEILHKNGSLYDATIIMVYISSSTGDNNDINQIMKTIYSELNNDVDKSFTTTSSEVTGDNSMMHIIMTSMTESQLLSTSFCLILAGLVLIIAYRNPVLGLIAMIPVAISTIWIVGTMYFIGYNLNVMTIMITSLTIGLGITYAIHAVERFRHIADKTGDVVAAVSETIGHTGGALTIAAITTIAGFIMLVFTPMPVEQQFGIITALTIFFALLTSIFILPPVLMFWGKWRKKHKGYVISKGDPNTRKKY
ncbi:MAG: MMPL family transporter, partial [Candidatus Thermoplasmatota archaeon]|nr:MMPL family transporter [Candidatus Thermoplasmatota archaeon]